MKKIKNRKQRGSVLLTVVFVMSILIVFLFGTMALAVANNNRAHVNYSSAQTGITARAVAESAIRAIENGTAAGQGYAKSVGELEAGDSPISVPVQLNGDRAGTLGNVENVIISHAGSKMYYDVTDKKWYPRDLLRFTATVTMGGVESTSSVYVLKHRAEDNEGSGGGGAGFVTVANAALECQTNIVGGAYITLPELDDARKYVYSNSHVDRTIDRTGRVGVTGEDVIGFGTVVANDGGATNAFNLNNAGAIIEADLYVNNNMYVQNWSGFVFPGPEKGITVWGDLVFNQNAIDQLYYEYLGDKEADFAFTEVPYIYVDGNISGRSGVVKLGNGTQQGATLQDFPLNIFCGTINCGDIDNNGGMGKNSVIAGNLYCMDKDGNSSIKVNNIHNQLFNWSESVVKKIKVEETATYVRGEICSNGNLTLGAMTDDLNIYGDVRVRGNLKIEAGAGKKVCVHGNVVVGGDITGIDNLVIVQEIGGEQRQIYIDKPSEAPDEIVVDIPNEVGYYYVYTPEIINEGENSGKYKAPNDELLHDGDRAEDGTLPDGVVFINGEYQMDATVEGNPVPANVQDLRIYYTLKQDGDRSIRPTDPNAVDAIDYNIDRCYRSVDSEYPFIQQYLEEHLAEIEHLKKPGPGGRDPHEDDDLEGFYIETHVVPGSFEEVNGPVPGEGRPGAPGNGPAGDGNYTVEHDGKTYQYKVSTNYSKVSEATFKYRYSESGGATYKHPNEYLKNVVNEKEGQIYPKYAERLVILGLEDETGTEYGDDGKIVKRMQEILEGEKKVANPYEEYVDEHGNDKLPDAVQRLHSAASATTYTAATLPEVLDANGQTQNFYIGESCTLDFAENTNIDKNLVITPSENGTLIIVENFVIQAGYHILIDDSTGGNVYFYIKDNGKFIHNGSAGLMTMTYYNAIYEEGITHLSYKSGDITYEEDGTVKDYTDIEDLDDGSPNVYIYGGKGSTMTFDNMGLVTANIISPYLHLDIKGGSGSDIDSFVYDGYDVVQGRYHSNKGDIEDFPNATDVNNIVIGCVNVSSAFIPNTFCSIYIPAGETGSGGGYVKDDEWWYKVLYYSEF